jgi:hypothetical protein
MSTTAPLPFEITDEARTHVLRFLESDWIDDASGESVRLRYQPALYYASSAFVQGASGSYEERRGDHLMLSFCDPTRTVDLVYVDFFGHRLYLDGATLERIRGRRLLLKKNSAGKGGSAILVFE